MSKLSLGVQRTAEAALVAVETGLSTGRPIPATVDDLKADLGLLSGYLNKGGWYTAAAVYAWTEPGTGGPRTGRKAAQLSIRAFADLSIRGLSHKETVASYRHAWERAIKSGWAVNVLPGDVPVLPAVDFAAAEPDLSGLKASGIVEWYTPAVYIEAARAVMGGIDLDPATSELANRTVGAGAIFTLGDDGLSQTWGGRVWLNPPYGKGSGLFTTKLVEEYDAARVTAAVLLLNAYGFDSDWFQPLWRFPICFTDHRITFTSPQRETGGPANGNIFVYLGPDEAAFAETFGAFGHVVRVWPG